MSVALSDLFSRRRKEPADPDAGDAPAHPTKVLARFVASLSARTQPVLLDLGPVVGANVSFFGEQLGCKIIVEDISKDIDRHVRDGKLDDLPASLSKRFHQENESIDGILCWDVFDFLDRAAALSLAATLARLLVADGSLLGFFSTAVEPGRALYTKYVVVERGSLRYRTYGGTQARQRSLQNRDIIKLFEGLRVSDSFLLQTHLREILFRKPAYLSGGTSGV